jgi:hypothetical protein
MTSNINFNAINEQYPVAGKDNNSQGFRDNFNVIKSGLATAKSEISDLQVKSLLNQDLVTTDPVTNDLKGSSITNGFYNNFHGLSYISTVNGTTNVVTNSASIFVYTLTGNTTFTFTNWPTNTHYAKVKLHFTSSNSSSHTVSLYSAGGGTIKPDNQFPAPFSVTNASHKVIEAWTYNHGATVFVKYLGSF